MRRMLQHMLLGVLVLAALGAAQTRTADITAKNFAVGDGKLSFDIVARATAGPAYRVGTSDLILDLDTSALGSPSFVQVNPSYTGLDDTRYGGTTYGDYAPMLVFMLGGVKLDVQIYFAGNGSGVAASLPSTEATICRVQMVIKAIKPYGLQWNAPASRLSDGVLSNAVVNSWLGTGSAPALTLAPTLPASPFVSDSTQTSLTLTWTDLSSTEDGYVVERSADGSTGWSVVANRPANAGSYTDGTLSPATAYFYRVKVYKGTDTATTATFSGRTMDVPVSVQGLKVQDGIDVQFVRGSLTVGGYLGLLQVLDLQGRVMAIYEVTGTTQIPMPLPVGTYMVRTSQDVATFTVK